MTDDPSPKYISNDPRDPDHDALLPFPLRQRPVTTITAGHRSRSSNLQRRSPLEPAPLVPKIGGFSLVFSDSGPSAVFSL